MISSPRCYLRVLGARETDSSCMIVIDDERDSFRENVCKNITEGSYLPDVDGEQKKLIRKRAKDFELRNGQLFYRGKLQSSCRRSRHQVELDVIP